MQIKKTIDLFLNLLRKAPTWLVRYVYPAAFVALLVPTDSSAQGRFVLLDVIATHEHSATPVSWNWENGRYEVSFEADYGGPNCIGQHKIAFKFSSDPREILEDSPFEIEVENIGEDAPCDGISRVRVQGSQGALHPSKLLPADFATSGTFDLEASPQREMVLREGEPRRLFHDMKTRKIVITAPYEAFHFQVVRPWNTIDRLYFLYGYEITK
ncbi:MAG: hypothetical protein AAF393_00635 [Pseudomonadota bacterium]